MVFSTPLTLHWRLPLANKSACRTRQSLMTDKYSAQPDLSAQLAFVRRAEYWGFDSLLVDFGLNKPDAVMLAAALALRTKKMAFIVACRSGITSPVYFVQQLNTLSQFIPGRLALNMVAGHSPAEQRAYGDCLDHEQRYARTEEFLTLCDQLWTSETAIDVAGDYYTVEGAKVLTEYAALPSALQYKKPLIFVAGGSKNALRLAKHHGDIWLSMAAPVDDMKKKVREILVAGKEAAIRLSVICRDSRAEAREAAEELIADASPKAAEHRFVSGSDSQGFKNIYRLAETSDSSWFDQCLWSGAVASHGASAMALVGTPEDIAEAINAYRNIGISHFIFSGWPQQKEMDIFGSQVLPVLKHHSSTDVLAGVNH